MTVTIEPTWDELNELTLCVRSSILELERKRDHLRERLAEPRPTAAHASEAALLTEIYEAGQAAYRPWLDEVERRVERLHRVLLWVESARMRSAAPPKLDEVITCIARGMGVEPKSCIVCGNLFATRESVEVCPECDDDDEGEDELSHDELLDMEMKR